MKEQMRDDMRDQIMGEKMRGKVLSDVTITPSEVKTFFAQIPVDSLPYFNQEVEIAEIVGHPKPNALHEKAGERQTHRHSGENHEWQRTEFEAMAKKFSQDPGSGRTKAVTWVGQNAARVVPEFEAAAYKLEPGDMSPVIESDFGFHIIQLS
ncbi:MAG: peptidylprolyl isomerase [Saprospiraceae bacterium]|nr:peptidylprolyl isomerase [Saprospiraceae bacterium]